MHPEDKYIHFEDKMNSIYQDDPEAKLPWTEMLNLAPHVFWAVVALIIFFIIGPSRIRDTFTKVNKIGLAGFEVELKSEIEAAVKARNIDLPYQLRDRLVRRLEHCRSLISGARILWIDDHPNNNTIEIGLLRHFGAIVDLALSNQDARERLKSAVYDVVLSDITRENVDEDGKDIVWDVKDAVLTPPLIFYVGEARPIPEGAFGLTIRLDELLHLILDALERR